MKAHVDGFYKHNENKKSYFFKLVVIVSFQILVNLSVPNYAYIVYFGYVLSQMFLTLYQVCRKGSTSTMSNSFH